VSVSNREEWVVATREFLASPEGENWTGSQNNLEVLGYLLRSNGLEDAPDKVAALKACAAEMHERGLDVSPTQPRAVDANASPAEILKNWKAAYGDDPVKVGEAFRKWFT